MHYRVYCKLKNPSTIRGLTVTDGDVFENCNFSQSVVDTDIFVGKQDLVFVDCNLDNCKLPTGSKTRGGSRNRKSLCTNIMPHLEVTERCPENCEHVISTDNTNPRKPVYTYQNTSLGNSNGRRLTSDETVTALEPYKQERLRRNKRASYSEGRK